MNTTLQVPLPKSLKTKATIAAKDMGFSSLQDVVRILLTKLARKQLRIEVEETEVHLSPQNEKRYMKMAKDFEKGKNVRAFSGVEELMKDLHR